MLKPLSVNEDIGRVGAVPHGRESVRLPGILAAVVVPAVALLIAVSNQSAWIDEASTGLVARQPTLPGAWGLLTLMKGSDLQMPLYMLFVWASDKVVGATELTMRLAGLLWLVPGVAVFVASFRRDADRVVAALVVATSAFAWYYANEARPYAMQVGVSCAIVGALRHLMARDLDPQQRGLWLAVYAAGLLALSGSSMLGMIWVPAALAAPLVLLPREDLLDSWRRYRLGFLVVTLALFAIGVFYLWTLTSGARASDAARTDVRTVVYIFYEQLGFTGLGPGRTEMRESPVRALMPYLPLLAIYGVVVAGLFAAAVYSLSGSATRARAAMLTAVIAAPGALLILAALVTHFRLLGRHWAPLMPIWYLMLTLGAVWLWQRPSWPGKSVVAAFAALSLWSCLEVRFAPRHAHDDYRSAVAAAQIALAADQTVWWNAAEVGGLFYGLPLSINAEEQAKGILITSPVRDATAVLMFSPPASSLTGLTRPDVIIASKPDIYDQTGALAEYIAAGHFRQVATYAAFTVWRADEARSATAGSPFRGAAGGMVASSAPMSEPFTARN